MFEAVLAKADLFRKIIESIKDLVTDVNIDVTHTGLSLQSMDSSHVALVSLILKNSGFDSYRADRSMTLGISVSNLCKVLKLSNPDDKISLRADDIPSCLHIIFENEKEERKTEFNLNLITLDSEHLGIPDTAYNSEVTMNAYDFTRICRELHLLSETVQIEATTKYLKFAIDGEVGSGQIQINTPDGGGSDDAQQDNVTLSFALRYLNMLNKASTLTQMVKLQLALDTPLVVEYEISNLGSLKYYLAPKINEDGHN